jgi:hypothetical protein
MIMQKSQQQGRISTHLENLSSMLDAHNKSFTDSPRRDDQRAEWKRLTRSCQRESCAPNGLPYRSITDGVYQTFLMSISPKSRCRLYYPYSSWPDLLGQMGSQKIPSIA